jgi:outer membrane protein
MRGIMKNTAFILLAALIMTTGVNAQQSAPAKRAMSMSDAIQVALDRNINIIQGQVALQQQQSSVTAAYGGLLPSLSANGYWQRAQNQSVVTFIQGVGTLPIGQTSTSNSFSTGINTSVTLFNGFTNTSNVTRATAGAASAEHSLDRTRQTVVFQTQSLYYNVLRNEQLVKVNDDNLKRDQKQLDQIVESNKVGAKALADVYRQQVQVGNDELALISAQNTHEKAIADLVFYLALSLDVQYDFHDASIPSEIDSATIATPVDQNPDFMNLYLRGKALRPDYKSQEESVKSADASVVVARGGHYPSISFSGGYNLSSDELSTLSDNRHLSWGLSFSLPLFSGFSVSNQVQQAQLTLRNQQELLSQTERQIQVDIKKGMLDVDAARKQLEVAISTVKSATEDQRIAQEKYNLGAGTILDLLVGTANYTNAISNKVNAVYQYLNAKSQLQYAFGTTVH